MPKKFIKRFMPDHHMLRNHKYLRIFGQRLHDPNLWHLNRRSASGAFAVGLFMAFIPVPFQMVFAALGAFWFRVNLPIAVALVWLTNPITMPPVFYGTYKLGNWLMGRPAPSHKFEVSYEWLMQELDAIWQPFLLGSLLVATLSAVVGYFAIRGLWRLQVVRHWQRKKDARAVRESSVVREP
jgi:hypothetical protein